MATYYAFCETAVASPFSKWHIRKLTKRGRMLGGGADTLSLCGRTIAWDIDAIVDDEEHLEHCCQRCCAIYKKAPNGVEAKEK